MDEVRNTRNAFNLFKTTQSPGFFSSRNRAGTFDTGAVIMNFKGPERE
jgi:hypothetical protein